MKKAKLMQNMSTHSVPQARSSESGISLVETMIATVLIAVGLMAVLGLFAASMVHNQAHGDLASRATTYGQTKMEALLALQFTDASTDTTVWPYAATGKGLCDPLAANATCGGVDPANPVVLGPFVDYLDYQGMPTTATATLVGGDLAWRYMRQWMIQADASTNLKTVTVRTSVRRTVGS